MDINALLDRISARARDLRISETEVSRAVGSADMIRNWRRAVADGKSISPRHDSLVGIAKRLGVPVPWLIGEVDGDPPPVAAAEPRYLTAKEPSSGFSENAAPYQVLPQAPRDGDTDQTALLRAIYGRRAVQPSALRLIVALPAFGLQAGDILVIDLGRLPRSGEIAVVSVFDDQTASSATMIMRIAEPWLMYGDTNARDMLRLDDPTLTVRHPVIGSIRGLTESE